MANPFTIMTIEIPFGDLKPCEAFESTHTKRHFHGIKIVPICMLSTSGPKKGRLIVVNAVIARDHTNKEAEDAGQPIFVEFETLVTVFRSPAPGS